MVKREWMYRWNGFRNVTRREENINVIREKKVHEKHEAHETGGEDGEGGRSVLDNCRASA
jgi:hypothetical protein